MVALPFGSAFRALVTSDQPRPPQGWEQPRFDDSAWPVARAPFSSIGEPGSTAVPAGGEVLARATFTVPAGATNVTVEARLRGDVALFVNGCSAGNYANDGGSGIIDVVGPVGCRRLTRRPARASSAGS